MQEDPSGDIKVVTLSEVLPATPAPPYVAEETLANGQNIGAMNAVPVPVQPAYSAGHSGQHQHNLQAQQQPYDATNASGYSTAAAAGAYYGAGYTSSNEIPSSSSVSANPPYPPSYPQYPQSATYGQTAGPAPVDPSGYSTYANPTVAYSAHGHNGHADFGQNQAHQPQHSATLNGYDHSQSTAANGYDSQQSFGPSFGSSGPAPTQDQYPPRQEHAPVSRDGWNVPPPPSASSNTPFLNGSSPSPPTVDPPSRPYSPNSLRASFGAMLTPSDDIRLVQESSAMPTYGAPPPPPPPTANSSTYPYFATNENSGALPTTSPPSGPPHVATTPPQGHWSHGTSHAHGASQSSLSNALSELGRDASRTPPPHDPIQALPKKPHTVRFSHEPPQVIGSSSADVNRSTSSSTSQLEQRDSAWTSSFSQSSTSNTTSGQNTTQSRLNPLSDPSTSQSVPPPSGDSARPPSDATATGSTTPIDPPPEPQLPPR